MTDMKAVLSNVTINLPYEVALSAHAHLRLTDWMTNETPVSARYKKLLTESWGEELFQVIIDAVARLGEEPRRLGHEETDD